MTEKVDNGIKPLTVKSYASWWWNFDLKKSYHMVERLRQRIFRATRQGDMKKVRGLQKLMLRSFHNIVTAVHRVTQQNKGKVTAGIDKVTSLTPVGRAELVEELMNNKTWKPLPTKRVEIPKRNGKKRPLGIPTVMDRCLQAIVKNALEPFWEAQFEPTSYGFRPSRSAKDAQARLYMNLKSSPQGKPPKKQWIVEADIKGCFDNISHDFLRKKIGNFPARTLIHQWLKVGYVDKGVFYETNAGTPQGGIISPLLANIALDGLESHLGINYRERKDKKGNPWWENISQRAMVRYADDFIICCETRDDAEKALEETEIWLKERGLQISPEKTRITEASEGFDFLGWNFRLYKVSNTKSGVKTLIKPSLESIKSVRQSLKDCFKKHRGNNLTVLIKDANAIIRGWSEYHKGAVSSEIFATLDNWLYDVQWKWVKRRSPKMINMTRKERYFGKFNPNSNNQRVLGDKVTGAYMLKFSWTNIERHCMVTYNYSPDNPDLREYWDKRNKSISKSKEKTASNKKVFNILSSQDFVCPVCNQSLTFTEEVRHLHHVIPRQYNGGDHTSNLRMLHASCHHKIHVIGETTPEALKLLDITPSEYSTIQRNNENWWKKWGKDKNKRK